MQATSENLADDPGVLVPPPLVFALPLVLGLLLDWTLPIDSIRAPVGVRLPIGVLLVFGGGAIGLRGLRTMRQAHTSPSPRKTPRALVTTGPFAHSRNPLYVALVLVYAGIAISLNGVIALALLPVAVLVLRQGVVLREERYLEQRFGEEYRSYKARVRRWV